MARGIIASLEDTEDGDRTIAGARGDSSEEKYSQDGIRIQDPAAP